MLVYRGKLNWPDKDRAEDEELTFIVNDSIHYNKPVTVIWQWSLSKGGIENEPVVQRPTIGSVLEDSSGLTFTFGKARFFFTANAPLDANGDIDYEPKSLSIKISGDGKTSTSVVEKRALAVCASDKPTSSALKIFVGSLNWSTYAKNEQVVIVVPSGFGDGNPIGIYFQWTVDANGEKKVNVDYDGTMFAMKDHLQKNTSLYKVEASDYYDYLVKDDTNKVELLMSKKNSGISVNPERTWLYIV